MVRVIKSLITVKGHPHREHRSQKVRKKFGKRKDKKNKYGSLMSFNKNKVEHVEHRKMLEELKKQELDNELELC